VLVAVEADVRRDGLGIHRVSPVHRAGSPASPRRAVGDDGLGGSAGGRAASRARLLVRREGRVGAPPESLRHDSDERSRRRLE